MEKLYDSFKKLVCKNELIDEFEKVLVGFSGGPDSRALFECLYEFKKEFSFEFSVAFVNYALRGSESQEEKLFVQDICKKKKIPLHIKDVSWASYPESGIQEKAREIRFSFFKELMAENNYTKVFLAHHHDDQIETFFFRLFKRPSNIMSLTCMSLKSIHNGMMSIRPFVFISKKTILNFLKENKITYKQDSSNKQIYYTRNQIRLSILPEIEKYFPDYKKSISLWIKSFKKLKTKIEKDLDLILAQGIILKRNDEIYFDFIHFSKLSDYIKTCIFHKLLEFIKINPQKLREKHVVFLIKKLNNCNKNSRLLVLKDFSIGLEQKKISIYKNDLKIIQKEFELSINDLIEKRELIYVFSEYLSLKIRLISFDLIQEYSSFKYSMILAVEKESKILIIKNFSTELEIKIDKLNKRKIFEILKNEKIPQRKRNETISISYIDDRVLAILVPSPFFYKRACPNSNPFLKGSKKNNFFFLHFQWLEDY